MTKPWEINWKEIEDLPSGGQGRTCHVEARNDARIGVMKVLRSQRNPKARRRMADEAHNLRKVRAAGGKVPEVFESNAELFESTSPLYFVMEKVDGSPCNTFVEKNRPVSLTTAIELITDLMRTITIANDEEVLHRDVKPNNLMIRSASPPDVVVLDFGLSFRIEQEGVTETSEQIGSRFLSLPERLVTRSDKRDLRSDLTLVAGLLFYLLTADDPIVLTDAENRLPHHRSTKIRDLSEDESKIASLERFFDRALQPIIEARFQSIDEFNRGLNAVLNPTLRIPQLSPAEFAKAMCADLARSDRASQLQHFEPMAKLVRNRIQEVVAAIQGNLDKVTLHCQINAPAKEFPGGVPPDFDVVISGDAVLAAIHSAHNFQAGVVYAIRAKGPDCVLLRRCFRANSNNNDRSPVGDWQVVYSFSGYEEPLLDAIGTDVKACIVAMMEDLQARIKSQTGTWSEYHPLLAHVSAAG